MEVKIGEHIISNVSSFQYLGLIIQSNEKTNGDVTYRIQARWMKWRNVLGVIYDHEILNKRKGKLYKTVVISAMLYGNKCWTLKG